MGRSRGGRRGGLLLKLLCSAAALALAATQSAAPAASPNSETVLVQVNSICPVLDIQTKQQPSNTRNSCYSPCVTSGALAYSVSQGSALTVLFSAPSAVVIIGGSSTDGFMDSAVPDMTNTTAPAASNPISGTTVTGFTFAPNSAFYPSFVDRTQAQLAIYAFDTRTATTPAGGGAYSAKSCRFTMTLTVLPASQSPINSSQLYLGAAGAASASNGTPVYILIGVFGAVIAAAAGACFFI